jgi:heat shock protein HslJ
MDLKSLTLLSATLLLCGCAASAPQGALPVEALKYSALGTEPFWSLKIENGTMAFDHGDDVSAKANSYTTQRRPNGWRYVSDEMTVDVTFEECSDGMSEFNYKDSVTVAVRDLTYKGCGGGILPPTDFERTSWRVTSINGVAIGLDRRAFFEFANGKISGTIGCNRMSGSFTYKNKRLAFGPVASTRMGCPDPVAAQETAFAKVLGSVSSMEFPGDGSMVLTGNDGSKVVLDQMM